MQGTLAEKLPSVISELRQLQSSLQKVPLDPANLGWSEYLDQIRTLSQQFKKLVRSIPPEFRHFVAYPTHSDPPQQNMPIETLLLTGIPELSSENALCRQRYREQIEQMGLAEMSAPDRQGVLLEQVESHNLLCEAGVKRIQQAIEKNDLDNAREPFRPAQPPRRKPEADLLMHLITGRDLPVPASLR